jgi:HD-GYP domain-containing protein (c-di-GMP phosphodiesterase class II)
MIAMGHHIYADGSGYPRRLDFNDLPPLVHLATLIDHFDALTSPRSYRPAHDMYDAIKIILLQREKYHPGALENFIRVVGVYPVSTFLKLASGETAVVVSNNPDNLFLPEVKIVLDSDSSELAKEVTVNLIDEPDRRPVEVLTDI